MGAAATDVMRVVERWDASLRAGDWEAARRLRQPAWGEDADEGLIRRLEDHPDREAALAAIAGPT